MADFNLLEGTLYVGEPAANNDMYSDDAEDLYSRAVFTSDVVDLVFYTGMGGYYSVKPTHFHDTTDGTIYYPHQNEAVAEIHVNGLTDDLTQHRDTAALEYTVINNTLYIRSQNEITAYGGTPLVQNNDLYRVQDTLLMQPDSTTERDELLDIDPVEEPVRVENIETGTTVPLPYDQVADVVENAEPNGALKVGSPDDVLAKFLDDL